MAKRVVIIERLGHRPSGTVLHDLEVDGEIIIDKINYLDARKLAIDYIEPDTVVVERYESSGEEVENVGDLVDGKIKELGEV